MANQESSRGNPAGQDLTADIEASKSLRPGADHRRAYVGPPLQYDFMGATQFRLLTSLGLREGHSVLDIGCGSLRAGRLLIPYLMPDRYFGIEPNMWLVEDAIDKEIGRDMVTLKRPRFADNADFDLSVFGVLFDVVVAQSIFSHTGRDLFDTAMASIASVLRPGGQALITCIRPEDAANPSIGSLNGSVGWIYPECVVISSDDVVATGTRVGLRAQPLNWYHPRQTWYRLVHEPEEMLDAHQVELLTGQVLNDDRFTPT